MKSNKVNYNELLKSIAFVCIIVMCGYAFGFTQGFESGKDVYSIVYENINQANYFSFECNQYDEPYYSCDNDLKFQNATGLYCNNKLVCENKLTEN